MLPHLNLLSRLVPGQDNQPHLDRLLKYSDLLFVVGLSCLKLDFSEIPKPRVVIRSRNTTLLRHIFVCLRSPAMSRDDSSLATVTARLMVLIEDQERLFHVIRKEKAELVREDTSLGQSSSTSPAPT